MCIYLSFNHLGEHCWKLQIHVCCLWATSSAFKRSEAEHIFVCRSSPLVKAGMIRNSLFAWTLGGWQRVLVGAHLWSFTTMRTPAGRMPPSFVYSFTGTAYHLTWKEADSFFLEGKRGWFLCSGKSTKGFWSCLPPVATQHSNRKDWSAQFYFCG